MIKTYQGDCFSIIPTLPENSFDLILTDPPYGCFGRNWDSPTIDWSTWWNLIERVSKPNCSYIIFSSFPHCINMVGPRLKWLKYDIVFQKKKPTGFLNARRQPLRSHELILFLSKGKSVYNPQGLTSVNIKQNRKNKSAKGLYNEVNSKDYTQKEGNFPKSVWGPYKNVAKPLHPAQKPLKLIEDLILTYSNEGDNILDPFAGSGTTGRAAKLLNRNCSLIEKDDEFIEWCKI